MGIGETTALDREDEIERCRVTGASDRLITELVEDLKPVRPIPRLRLAFAVILALWAAMLGLVLSAQEGEAGVQSLFTNRIYFGSFVGLMVASFGGTISALAAGVPGREKLEIRGMLVSSAYTNSVMRRRPRRRASMPCASGKVHFCHCCLRA